MIQNNPKSIGSSSNKSARSSGSRQNILKMIQFENQRLHEYYNDFSSLKETILTAPSIVEYLFQKPSMKYDTIEKIYKLFTDSKSNYLENYTNITRVTKYISDYLFADMIELIELQDKYHVCNDNYNYYVDMILKNRNKYPKYTYLSQRYTPLIQTIGDTLDNIQLVEKYVDDDGAKISIKYEISWIYNWTFKNDCKYNLDIPFVFDFFVVLVYRERLILFVIEVDRDINNPLYHTESIIKQIILFQMNVFVLRISQQHLKDNLKKRIIRFIKNAVSSKVYLSEKYITPNINLIDMDLVKLELEKFYQSYKCCNSYYHKSLLDNSTIYPDPIKNKFHNGRNMGITLKTDKIYNKDDDEYFDTLIGTKFTREPDIPIVVTDDVFDWIINKCPKEPSKKQYSERKISEKQQKYNDICISLVGKII
ncbi:hypothetical protein [Acanthamoeba polyphaga mimivirus]|nr:hypothetical protein [Acanthamoeba castellanii mamavirus]EJN41065.1 hypothetical protein lvs_R562 [Acanthamoeba polyphaga lentillevirus]UMZ07808.1 hypothetical protein [Acanthamoeba polyphaga mimivirus]